MRFGVVGVERERTLGGDASLVPFVLPRVQRGEDGFAPRVVEALHQLRIAAKPLRGGDILDPVVFPQAVVGAEGPEAALGADSRAGQDHDVADAFHCRHEARP